MLWLGVDRTPAEAGGTNHRTAERTVKANHGPPAGNAFTGARRCYVLPACLGEGGQHAQQQPQDDTEQIMPAGDPHRPLPTDPGSQERALEPPDGWGVREGVMVRGLQGPLELSSAVGRRL